MSSWSGITLPPSSTSSSSLLKDDGKDVQDGPAAGDASTLGEKSDERAWSAAAVSDHPPRAMEEESSSSSSSLFFVDGLRKFIAAQLKDDLDCSTVESLIKQIPYFGQCDPVSRIMAEFQLECDKIQTALASLVSSNEELQNRHDSLVMGSTSPMEIDDSLRDSLHLDSETLEHLNIMTPETRATALRLFVKQELRLCSEKLRSRSEKHPEKLQSLRERCLQEELRSKLLCCAADVEKAATKARTALLALSGLTLAEPTVSRTTTAKYSEASSDESIPTKRQRGLDDDTTILAESSRLYIDVIQNAKALKDALPNLCAFDDDDEKERLRRVSDTITAFFGAAEFVKKDDTATAGANQKKILHGLDVLKKKLFLPGDTGRLENGVAAAGPNADEVGSTQPHVALLLEAIGSCASSSQSETTSSPSTSHVRAATIMPPTELRPSRTLDSNLRVETKYRLCFQEDILFVPVEIKTGENGGKGPVALLDSALDQVLAALAKSCYVGYAFFQYGVPSHATGLIMNMAVAEVVHMKCVGIGTPQVNVELYRSGYLPLMTCPMFDKWVVGCAKQKYGKDYALIRRSLYGEDGTGGVTDGIPHGMTTLLNLMRQQGKVLCGMAVDTAGDLLGGVLGFGATSVVFKGKNYGGSGYAIKVARSNGRASEIRREIEVLRELGGHNNIPTVVDEETAKNEIVVDFGCVTRKLPALFTAPVGIDPVLYLSRNGVVRESIVSILQDGIVSALAFMHSRSYCHCDISPRNIVLAEYDDEVGGVQPRAILIDFATARKIDKNVSGFVGTPNYVHRYLFECFLRGRTPYKPRPSHDLAALGFTLAYFINSCRRSWSVGRYPVAMTRPVSKEEEDHLRSTMDDRLEAARLASHEYPHVEQLLANDVHPDEDATPPNESSTTV
jgi:hypothetical protein